MKTQYFGKQTIQAQKNFPFSYRTVFRGYTYAIAEVKKAAALANAKTGRLDEERKAVIVAACDEILSGALDDQFPLGAFQGGAGTSMNMNVNEVVAARAEEILKKQGKNLSVHPNDHVNLSQSTNDVNPTALKLLCMRNGRALVTDLNAVVAVFEAKAKEYKSVAKLARTHLQDAVPTTVGDELNAWASCLARGVARIESALTGMREINLGGTAIGNGINASPEYTKEAVGALAELTGFPFESASNMMAQTSSQTDFCALSHALVLFTLDASKIASDIRLLASGPNGGLGEFVLAELQPGSSIMPGKVNPVLPEAVNQLYFLVSGNALTIDMAAQASQLELGVMFPILADRLIESVTLTGEVMRKFAQDCVATLKVNEEHCRNNLERSTAYATLLTPVLGYDTVSAVVKESIATGKSIRTLILEKNLLTTKQFNDIVNGSV